MFAADPRAHAFEGRLYVYPSHDIEAGIPGNDEGDHFKMEGVFLTTSASTEYH